MLASDSVRIRAGDAEKNGNLSRRVPKGIVHLVMVEIHDTQDSREYGRQLVTYVAAVESSG